jgi:hypothetical protein
MKGETIQTLSRSKIGVPSRSLLICELMVKSRGLVWPMEVSLAGKELKMEEGATIGWGGGG